MTPATTMTLGVHWRPARGPALRRSRLPLGLTLLSAGAHGALLGAVMLAAIIWPAPETTVYVVNLVPAVAGVGVPEARPAPKAPPETKPAPPPPPEVKPAPKPPEKPPEVKPAPRPEPPVEAKPEPKPAPRPPEPVPPVARSTPAELPQRDAALPTREARNTGPAEMPARQTPRAPAALPEPERPASAPALTRPGDKEPPRVASAPRPSPPPPLRQAPPPPPAPPPAPTPGSQPAAAPAPVAPPPPPAPAAGRPSGSAAGSGAVTLEVTDFPYAYYLLAIQNKITERWQGRALDGRQPVATFQIDRAGRISGLAISKTSGNPYYDQAAMRAVLEAAPFPPLPQDFPGSFLRVHLGFNFAPDRG